MFQWWGYATACFTLLVAGSCALLWRRGVTLPLAALALLVAGAFPVLGLVPYYFLKISTVADRYLYLALLGPAFALASVFATLSPARKRLALPVAGALLLVYGVRSASQIPVWHDSYSLFSHTIAVNPRSALAHNNFGLVLADAKDFKGALRETLIAVKNAPGNADFMNNLGIAYAEADDMPRATLAFREAIRLKPSIAEAHYHLGVALADAGNLREAAPAFRDATRLEPRFTEAWYRLGTTLGKIGSPDEAIDALAKTLALRPADAEARYIRAVLLGNAKRDAEAEGEFAEVTRRMPGYAEAWYALGRICARRGETESARAAFAQCLSLDPENTKAREELRRLDSQPARKPF